MLLAAVITPVAACQTQAQPSDGARTWWPTSGSVILAGGGLTKESADALVDRLITLAGGPGALIVVIPTASVDLPVLPTSGPEPRSVEAVRQHLGSRGAKHITFLHTRSREIANTEEFVKVLRSAGAVFLTGGAFRVLDDTYHGTLVARELRALLARGGVLVGDSAGAIALGCFWVGWDPSRNVPVKSTDGLCVLPDVTVTPHLERFGGEDQRAGEILKYASTHPGTTGINIQENTFLVLRRGRAEVIGKGSVWFLDAARDTTKAYLRLSAGDRHDFVR